MYASANPSLSSELSSRIELTSRREAVVVFGGGARSLFVRQLLADVLDRPIVVSPTSETALLGAAMLAGLGAGLYADLEEAKTIVREGAVVVHPEAEAAAVYSDLFPRYREAEELLLASGELGSKQ